MSAYACEPNKGSEPGIGWNWACRAARCHDVWVFTRANNRPSIEDELLKNEHPNLHFIYHDLPEWARFWKKGGHGVYLYYLLWQVTALPKARRIHDQIRFDVGHHVTFGAFRQPTFLATLNIPFVWGPISGGERAPFSFYRSFGPLGVIKQGLREAINRLTWWNPAVRSTAARARLILAATPASAAVLPRWARARAIIVPAMGYDGTLPPSRPRHESNDSIRVLFVGRLVYWKGVRLALEAIAPLVSEMPTITMTIVGDGPDRTNLETLATRFRIDQSVRFLGNLSRSDVLELYAQHDIFVFPSLQDSGGFAVLEAMAAGLPVVCLDVGGPALALSEATGICVPAHRPAQTIMDITVAIRRLAQDARLRADMGAASQLRVMEVFSWQLLDKRLNEWYHEATSV